MHSAALLRSSLLYSLLSLITALAPTRLIYEFPNGTWVENLAVRSSGSILMTIITSPDLYMINPLCSQPTPVHLHHFDSALLLLGITETNPDTFHLVAANGTRGSPLPAPGSNRIYKVSFLPNSDIPHISLAATLPEAGFLNGLTTLNPTTVLAADYQKGVVWAINVVTGHSRVVLNDPLMAPGGSLTTLGINGVRLHGNTLYFTNSAQGLLAKIDTNADGTAAGKATVVARSSNGSFYDDFALDWRGDAFLATGGGNSIEEIGRGKQVIVAGNVNSTEIAEPTSAQFGRTSADREVLYVTTGGGLAIPVNGDEIVGGQLVAVDTKGLWKA